jgi:hypothetical protein
MLIEQRYQQMSDVQRSVKQLAQPGRSRPAAAQPGRKLAIYSLTALILSAMIAWFGLLGWGFVAMLQWLWDCIKSF